MAVKQLTRLMDLVNNYDVFVFDIWGVIIADDQTVYPGVVENINALMKIKPVYLLSNSPRPSSISYKRLKALGLNIKEENILTSGELTRKNILDMSDEFDFGSKEPIIYHLDQDRNQDILNGIDVNIVSNPALANVMLITVFSDNKNELEGIYKKLDKCLEHKLPAICANPDLFLSDFRYCAGFFAKYYKDNGGTVHYIGKPYDNMFKYMYESIREKTQKSKIILIGDTFYTDILGANNFGIDSGMVLTGNARTITKDIHSGHEEEIIFLMQEANKQNTIPNHFVHLGL